MSDDGLHLVHLNLAVADVERSIAFYRRWLGFTTDPVTYPDHTVFVRNADDFDLAFHAAAPAAEPAAGVHIGFRAASPGAVRSMRSSMVAAGIALTEAYDEPDYINCKLRDPDGYEIEIYWEPSRAGGG
jgi:catechol 2,3-dioxygenase-like lactoylglutathione lyase family enzyme